MKLYLITYDLKKISQNYSGLYEAIKSFDSWQHPMESTWVVKVGDEFTANQVYEIISKQIDKNDFLFVVEITGQDRQGWLAKTFWQWLKEHL